MKALHVNSSGDFNWSNDTLLSRDGEGGGLLVICLGNVCDWLTRLSLGVVTGDCWACTLPPGVTWFTVDDFGGAVMTCDVLFV